MVFKPKSRRAVVKTMKKLGCAVLRDTGGHTVHVCPCGQHTAAVPRHRQVSAGVLASIGDRWQCLERRWLQ
jgi:predicted RNA binding protein YcfA (HicA-like mRNA interferase family)